MRRLLLLLLFVVTAADHYQTLSVPRKATQVEVKAAYRRLARVHHPDKPEGCPERFRKINEANEVLSSPERRREYDARLNSPFAHARHPAGSSFPAAQGYSHPFASDPRFEAFFAREQTRQELKSVAPAVRIFACDLQELDSGCVKTVTLKDSFLSRLRDAVSEGRGGCAAQVVRQAAQQAAMLAASLVWRGYGNLLFGWGHWWLRVPLLAAAFVAYVCQQLPPSPEGSFDIRVRPGWRSAAASKKTRRPFAPGNTPARTAHRAPRTAHRAPRTTTALFWYPGAGTKITFARGARHVTFRLRETAPHGVVRRRDDLVYTARLTRAAAARGVTLAVPRLNGEAWRVELQPGEAHEGFERRFNGGGMPIKGGPARGDMLVIVRIIGA